MKRMLATILALAMVMTVVGVPVFAQDVTVEAGGSIQAAIDAAKDGDTITVKAGTYQEQLIISGKQISIVGEEGVVITGPADYTAMQGATAAGRTLTGIVNVQDGASVSISNVEVKGNPAAATAAQNITHNTTYTGIAVVNASADVQDCKITDITYEGHMQGMQNGIGLYALADEGEHTLRLTDSEITNFNKGAVVLRGMENLTATVTGNTITGYGEQGVIAQNGIQTGVESTVQNNTISGLIYAPDPTNDWAHGSAAVYFADGYSYEPEKHSPNTFTDVDISVYSNNLVEEGWSIQDAIDAAQPGDTIYIAPGTYQETLVFNKDYEGITLRPEGEAKSVIVEAAADPSDWTKSGAVRFEAGAKNITIDGLVLRGADTDQAAQEPSTVWFGADVENVTIQNSTITANGEAAISNIYGASNQNIVIDNNLIDGQTFTGDTVANVPKFGGDYQFQYVNVPRPAVQFNSCTGDIIFTNNTITAVTGALRASDTEEKDGYPLDAALAGTPLYNSILTIDTTSPFFEGNTIVLPEGYTNATDMIRFRYASALADGKAYNLGDNTLTFSGFDEGVFLMTSKGMVVKEDISLPYKTTVQELGDYKYYYYEAEIEATDAVDEYLIIDVSNDGSYLTQDATVIDTEEGVVYADVDGDDTAGNSYKRFTIGVNVFEVGAATEEGAATFTEAIEAANAAAEAAAAEGKTLTVYLKSGIYAADSAVIDQKMILKNGSAPVITGTITIDSELTMEGIDFQNGVLTISSANVEVKDADFVGVQVVVEETAEGATLENVSFMPDTTDPEAPVSASLRISAANTTLVGKDSVDDPTKKNLTFGAGTVVEVSGSGREGLAIDHVVVDTSEPEAEGIVLAPIVVQELIVNETSDIIYTLPEAEQQAQLSIYFGEAAAYEEGTEGLTTAYTVPVYAKGFTEQKQLLDADITLYSEEADGEIEIAGAVNLDEDSVLTTPEVVENTGETARISIAVDTDKASSAAPDENGAIKLFDLIVSGNGGSMLIAADTESSTVHTTKYLPDDSAAQEAEVILSGQANVELPTRSKPNPPEASVRSGTYTNSFYVTLTTDPEDSGDEIYYTTNYGTKPDTLYTGRIAITRNTRLTVMAVNADGVESDTETYTYTIRSNSSTPSNPSDRPNPGTPGIVYPAVYTHTAYLSGYPDSTVRPDASITREELASIIYRVMGDNIAYTPQGNVYSDVAADRWSAPAIEYLSQTGILSGYPDGTFAPEQYITRAEFAKVIAVWRGLAANGQTYFVDISNTWATDYINAVAAAGYMQGESTGIFAPERSITRAEVAAAVNRILGRQVAKDTALAKGNPFTDLSENHWAFADLMEASVQHNYTEGTNGYENWR